MINKSEADEFGRDVDQIFSNIDKSYKHYDLSDVYIFVSFDLVNSTKLKYQYSNWLRLIKNLIAFSNNDWIGLNFWKYNGDELLFYARITALNQLAEILHILYDRTNDLIKRLHDLILSDDKSNFAEDLIGIKTSVWMASVSNDENALNSKLDRIDTIDFAGINMDEGFRMSKCATQNKFIIDPKIVFLLCLVAEKINDDNFKNLETSYIDSIDSNKLKLTLDEILTIFLLQKNEMTSLSPSTFYTFNSVSNSFRIVGYEFCKGVWNDRRYPIIWFSDNWNKTIENVKYDECYAGELVTQEFINTYHENSNESTNHKTVEILKKIYNNVAVFKKAIDEILLHSNLQLYTDSKLDMQIDSRTYIYYSIVCIKRDTNGVLAFLRSAHRGHMPNIWDFDQQKNAQRVSGEDVITQIEDKFKNNFGLNIKVVRDEERKSLIPMDIHPIYRRGKLHNGILCFAYIEDEDTEINLLQRINDKLSSVVSGYGYNLYSKAQFVHEDQINVDEKYCMIDDNKIHEITYNDALTDSNSWNNHKKISEEKCATNFALTVRDAIHYKSNESRDSNE